MMFKTYHNPVTTAARIDSYSTDRMRDVVDFLSFPRPYGSLANTRARDFICQEFNRVFGEPPKVVGETKNVVMGDPNTAKIIVGGHYDSVEGTPGADDNASAIAAMFRIAANVHPKDKICFVAWNGEECGLLGSKEFVENIESNNCIEQVHVLEMVGYCSQEPNSQKNPFSSLIEIPTVGDFIGVVTDSSHLMDQILKGANSIPVVGLNIAFNQNFTVHDLEKMAPHLLRSDHYWFWERLGETAMWTDTAEFRNPNYHEKSDKPETLDYNFMAGVSDLIIELIKSAR